MLHDNNFENILDAVIANTKIEVNELYNRYVCGDIDNRRQDSILKLLFAIDNIKSKTTLILDIVILVITYYSKRCLIPLNN